MKTALVLFPGLGADEKLFFEQKRHFKEIVITPSWIAPKEGETLSPYCERYAEDLMKGPLAGISEVFLGGFSFGGMVALELASILSRKKNVKVRGVLLISSGRTNQIIRTAFKMQAAFGSMFPNKLIQLILRKLMLRNFVNSESLNGDQVQCLKQMAHSIDIRFFKWSLKACAQWSPGVRFIAQDLKFPIFEIQGETDSIIPRSLEPGVVTLKGANHLIQYTHAKEVNQWIEDVIGAQDSN